MDAEDSDRVPEDLLPEIRKNIELLDANLPTRVDSANISGTAKLPFKAEWFRIGLRWRFSELCRSALEEFEQRRFVSAAVLTRAAVETFASLWYLHAKLRASTESKTLGQIDEYLMRAIAGNRIDDTMPQAINVLNCIDKVNDPLTAFVDSTTNFANTPIRIGQAPWACFPGPMPSTGGLTSGLRTSSGPATPDQ